MFFSPSRPDPFSDNKASPSNFSEGRRYDSQSPDKGRNSFSSQERRNFSPYRDPRNFSRESGAGISHWIGGARISHHEVFVIYRPSDHALIFLQVGPRDMV